MSFYLWRAEVREAEEALRVANREVRDSILELGKLQDEWCRLSVLAGFEGSARQTSLEDELRRVRDELAYAREDVTFAEAHLAKVKASILGGRRG